MFHKAAVSWAVFHQYEQHAVVPSRQIPFLRQDITVFQKKARPRRVKHIGGRCGQGLDALEHLEVLAYQGKRLGQLVEALNEWMEKGGFSPWPKPQEAKQ